MNVLANTNEGIPLDLGLIHNISWDLSYVVQDYEKGRCFGSPGENYSKDLINDWMQNIGLYTTNEPVLNETSIIFLSSFRIFQFNDDLQNSQSELIIYNQTSGMRESLKDFFITPRWNHTMFGLLGVVFERNQLTTTFNETNLTIIPRPGSVSYTINETTARTITSGNQLALDTIFNGHIRASDLTHGTGTYRVYAAFRDSEENILRTDDDVELEAWWQFSKT